MFLSYGAPLPSRDRKQIFAIGSQTRGELIRYDSATKRFLPTLGGMSVTDVMYSQDGKWLVYLSYPDHTLWRSRAVGTERMQLTYAPLEVFYPHISPDGKQVVFSAWLPGRRFEVFIVSMSGGEPRHVADGIPAASQGEFLESQIHAPDGAPFGLHNSCLSPGVNKADCTRSTS